MARKKFNCDTPGCDGFQFAMSPICTRCFVALPVEERTPPVPAGCDLRSFPDMPVDVIKLHGADMHLEVTPEEGWYAFLLWMKSWHTVPAASLSKEDRTLAMAAGLGRDLRHWKKVRAGAIRGFVECSDGRLYHLVLADKACNAWDVRKGRVRGANLTNSRSKNGQAPDNAQNASRSAPRSIYKERDGERDAPEPLSEAEAPRSSHATEQNRTELRSNSAQHSTTAREPGNDDPAGRAALAVELGQEIVKACGYDPIEVMEFSKVHAWLNAGMTGDEIRACMPIVAQRLNGKKPRALLAYLDPMLREEVAKMRNGLGAAATGPAPSSSDADTNRMRNRARHFVKTGDWDEPRWGSRDLVPANIWDEVKAEIAAQRGAA